MLVAKFQVDARAKHVQKYDCCVTEEFRNLKFDMVVTYEI